MPRWGNRGGVAPRLLNETCQADAFPARESLDHLATLGTRILLPGHENTCAGPIAQAVDLVRSRA